MNKQIHISSLAMLQSVIRKVMEIMEILNRIPEKDFERIVKTAQKRKPHLKKVMENCERGNVFLMFFFIRELLQAINEGDE